MKKYLTIMTIAASAHCHAVDFNDVKTPFFAIVEVTDGVTPRDFELRYDGESQSSLKGEAPAGAPGNLRMVGNSKDMTYFFWVENDPRKVVMTMDEKQFATNLGIDLSSIKENSTNLGKKEFIGIECTHWRKDIQITHQGKEPTGYIEACITKEGIPLWEKESGRLVMKAKMLELGKQDEQWFKAPSDHKVVDMNALMQSLKALQK
ncbi:MAG: hypothetical protein KBT77_05645 [Thalassolituus oleivorans]|uniref:hypothetical protein n=1 Tax=Thalassolituus oleivorans TaxID=187493 RepID=UPI001B69CFD1|nr:hypothetical protein [Thalassolituus oleivorans]MBQ0726816.1 hypothetical protein [Thalassolituus oleivorans]MBQ0779557.1 hypothetical protein [Thalassolituus oleivorans]